jgi:hypothetical protein
MAILTCKFNPEQGSEQFDHESGNCSIEYYNVCKDPYRVSANKFPVPWPWICGKHSKVSAAIHEQLDDSIQKILSDHKILASVGVYNKASRNTPEDAVDVLLIRTRSIDTTSWKAAATELYKIIDGREVDFQIDIDYPAKYDVRETRRFRGPLVTQYEESAKVIKRLDETTAQGPIGHVRFASGHRLTDTNHRMD